MGNSYRIEVCGAVYRHSEFMRVESVRNRLRKRGLVVSTIIGSRKYLDPYEEGWSKNES